MDYTESDYRAMI